MIPLWNEMRNGLTKSEVLRQEGKWESSLSWHGFPSTFYSAIKPDKLTFVKKYCYSNTEGEGRHLTDRLSR